MKPPDDVMVFLSSRFSLKDQAEAQALLAHAPVEGTGQSPARLLRCAIFASQGSIEGLRHYVSLLAVDWRDVIVAGEYDPQGQDLLQVRDLNQPLQV
jgi:hypothetical protein